MEPHLCFYMYETRAFGAPTAPSQPAAPGTNIDFFGGKLRVSWGETWVFFGGEPGGFEKGELGFFGVAIWGFLGGESEVWGAGEPGIFWGETWVFLGGTLAFFGGNLGIFWGGNFSFIWGDLFFLGGTGFVHPQH